MIDLSDGLASDAGQIGRASGALLRIELDALPLAPGVASVAAQLGLAPWQLAAGGGEDYELCFCAPAASRSQIEQLLARAGGEGVSWIGEVTKGSPGVVLVDEHGGEHALSGFEHRW
jgi:thiamine-monophosphate kinase